VVDHRPDGVRRGGRDSRPARAECPPGPGEQQDSPHITELTLGLLLFSDASTVRLRDVEGDASLPNRLLFVGLPLTVLAGTLAAHLLLPDADWAPAALIATILAPTDAALGLAVVTNKDVPVRIRRALNVESGLNDGIVTPFVTLFIAVVASEEDLSTHAWGLEALKQIGLAIVAAAAVGYAGGKLLVFAKDRGWTSEVSEQIAILALALLAYGGSVTIGGNGFVAAFAGGILFGAATRRSLERPGRFTETLGMCASFLVWSIFGALFVGELFTHELPAAPIAYALLSLTVIRMVPVAVALIGTHLRPATVAFMGWFGPRGLASVVFTLIALEEFEQRRREHPGRDGRVDDPALGSAARVLRLAASRPLRSVDSGGGRSP
jgi:NhaP-type Na+/H+ or K+/H+ antiporter